MLRNIKIYNFGPIEKEIIFSMEKGKTTQFEKNVIENTNLLKTMYIYLLRFKYVVIKKKKIMRNYYKLSF